ncbi:MAG: family transporter solute-binding subunit [Bacillota bacterium]|jgi:TRAP transporter TAXI family solute receptor|nr:family transporter solute-binding subunit [Bacillota bacterium]
MGRRKIFLTISLIIAILASVSGCAKNTSEQSNETSQKTPKFLTIGTANTGGAYYPIGIAMADLLTNNLKISTTAQTTGGAVENNTLVGSGKVDLALTQGSMAYQAVNGNAPYDKKIENISLMFSGLSKGVFQIIVNENSSIKTIQDLKGKKVVLGPPGGGAIPMTTDVFSVLGITMDDIEPVYVSYDDGTDGLTDGNYDAVVVQSAVPSSSIVQLTAAKKPVRLIGLDDETIKKVTEKFPYYAQVDITKDVYGLTEDTNTVFVSNCVVVSNNLSDELVYNMTKLFFENVDRIAASHPSAKSLTLEGAVETLPIPLHPGALKYFEEMGVK